MYLKDYKLAINDFDSAGNCVLKTDTALSLSYYILAMDLLIEMGDHKEAQNYSEKVAARVYLHTKDISLISKFYDNIIEYYAYYVDSDVFYSFINKYRFKRAEYLFKASEYERALEQFVDIIRTNNGTNCDKELTELSFVNACLIAILTQRTDTQKYIDELYRKSSDSQDSVQYLLIKRIIESLHDKNYKGMKDLGERLSINGDNVTLFNARSKEIIDIID
ncbi:hypothetical protein RF11_02495 [Thelohanellus kitauei]|uniref:Uncharacterized protein n=1 Tax=Thelohanellus kitauei TaxID=669202 RepID=A0A0C2M5L9_THEKT|nr:hypothetical protein RF11_02495 [Thelohanellus kitauei]